MARRGRRGRRPGGSRDRLRRHRPRARPRGRAGVDPRARRRQPRQRRRVRDRPGVGHRGVGGVDREPLAVLAQRRVLRAPPRARRRGLLPERPARVGRQQRRGRELSVAVRRGRLGRGPRRAQRGGLVLQPRATRGVRGPRPGRRRRLARRRADDGDRQQLRRAAHRGAWRLGSGRLIRASRRSRRRRCSRRPPTTRPSPAPHGRGQGETADPVGPAVCNEAVVVRRRNAGQRSPWGFSLGPRLENSPSVVGPIRNRWPSTSLPSSASGGGRGRLRRASARRG